MSSGKDSYLLCSIELSTLSLSPLNEIVIDRWFVDRGWYWLTNVTVEWFIFMVLL